MTAKTIRTGIALLALVSMHFCAVEVNAQFELSWYTIDAGGGYAYGGNFELNGTGGQHDAGTTMTGGNFELTGGFWVGNAVQGPIQTVADSISLFRGILLSGELSDTFDSDDSSMNFNPGLVLNSTEAPVWLIFNGSLPSNSPNSLSLVMESQAGTPGLTGTLDAWNWQNGSYDEVDVTSTSFNTDSVVTVDLSNNINEYVDLVTGAVRTRIGWRKTGLTINFPWVVRLDQMVWLTQ